MIANLLIIILSLISYCNCIVNVPKTVSLCDKLLIEWKPNKQLDNYEFVKCILLIYNIHY